MTDPAQYKALLHNIFRLTEDAELLMDSGRWASANALAIFALEEAGKYTALLSEQQAPKKTKLHIFRQEVIGGYFKSVAVFEAFVRDKNRMLEYLKKHSPESYAEAAAMAEPELIRFAIAYASIDPGFDMDKFVRKIVGTDPSMKFGEEAKAGDFHRERQQSIHVDYDGAGKLLADPSTITEDAATSKVDMARLAAELQKFWLTS